MKREQDLLKNTGIIAFGMILPRLAGVITLPVITAQLAKNEYGTYELISSLVAVLLPMITLQIQTTAFRFLIECEQDEQEKKIVITTILIFVVSVSAIALTMLFVVLSPLNKTTRILIILYFGMDIILNVLQQISRGIHNNKLYSLSSIVVSICNMVLVLLTVQVVKMRLYGVLFSIGLATSISAIFLIYKLKIWNYVKLSLFSWERLKELLVYSWPMVPNSLSNWIMNLSDRFIIAAVLGLEANAVYSVANKIPNLFTAVQGTFVMAWQENASMAAKDDDIELYYTKMFHSVFRIYFGIMAWLIALTPVLFMILIQGDYDEAYYQMPILYMALFFLSLASFVGGIYVAAKKTKSIGITTIIAAIINVLANLMLIKFIGIYAGAISTFISYFVLAVYRMRNVKGFMNIKYDYRNIIAMILILCGMCFLCGLRQLSSNIFNVLVALIASIIFNRSIIAKFYKHNLEKISSEK